MAKDDPDVWFEPKRYGLGAGLPVAWQGWVLIAGYLVVLFGMAAVLAARRPTLFMALAIVLTAGMLVISAQHTRGGWHWRWGGDE